MYKINEIFNGIQGEGYWSGKSVIFIRFSGCNLECKWCDTEHEQHCEASLEAIVDEINLRQKEYPNTVPVVLTGGEPLLQVDDDFVTCFKNLGYRLHVETNGTIPFNLRHGSVDWVAWSPKNKNYLKQIIPVNEVKVVIPGNGWDIDSLDELYLKIKANYFIVGYDRDVSKVMFSVVPQDGVENKDAVEMCLEIVRNLPQWRIGVQLHKILGLK